MMETHMTGDSMTTVLPSINGPSPCRSCMSPIGLTVGESLVGSRCPLPPGNLLHVCGVGWAMHLLPQSPEEPRESLPEVAWRPQGGSSTTRDTALASLRPVLPSRVPVKSQLCGPVALYNTREGLTAHGPASKIVPVRPKTKSWGTQGQTVGPQVWLRIDSSGDPSEGKEHSDSRRAQALHMATGFHPWHLIWVPSAPSGVSPELELGVILEYKTRSEP